MHSSARAFVRPGRPSYRRFSHARIEPLEARRLFDAVNFTSSDLITIPATGTGDTSGSPADPYPDTLNVSGLTGSISKLTVTIDDFSHTSPQDVDLLLVGPTGRSVLLMSNVGEEPVNDATFTFDDSAANLIPLNPGPADGGTYRPTDVDAFEVPFPAPAPAGPWSSVLGTFNGTSANGQWNLYAVDDAPVDVGTISGWSLAITSDMTPPTAIQSTFLYQRAPQTIQFTFSKTIGQTLTADDFSVLDTDTGQTYAGSENFQLIYDGTTNTAAFRYAGGTLPDGNYTATIAAAGVTDETGLPLDGNGDGVGGDDLHFNFFSLMGDANRDRVVNAQDFAALAANYGTPDAGWPQGDFNGDGQVDSSDFNLLAAHYNVSVPAPQSAMALSLPTSVSPGSLFSNHSIVKDGLASLFTGASAGPLAV